MNQSFADRVRSFVDLRSERVRTEISRLLEIVRVRGHVGVTDQ